MISVHLTQDQREELSAMSRQAICRVAMRAHMVLLSDRGFTVPQIAVIHACGEDLVPTWLHRYEQQGSLDWRMNHAADAQPKIPWSD